MIDTKVQLKKDILSSQQFSWLDNIYINNIPAELENEMLKTTMLISDINSKLANWANDTFTGVDKSIQVQVFFSKQFQFNFDEVIKTLLHFFVQNDWRSNGFSNFIDPDTKQESVTIKIHKIMM
ncbi:DUF806 family protein [Fructilactobacillus fructivorans]|uniref:DUF806 family protein n=1 Tax=Fructilactobacillus fructivorans TaxID=1614 RepID=UPI0007053493|nr:DUF806 family protein [Fructilactobacillus fructivorans]